MHKKETPIFYDESGKRWLLFENCIIIFITVLGVMVFWAAPLVFELRKPPEQSAHTIKRDPAPKTAVTSEQLPSVEDLMELLGPSNIAVIGNGPLVRLAKVDKDLEGAYLSDPFSSAAFQKLSDKEMQFINGDLYAIQRYGDVGEKRLFLTFDDGPDNTFTPVILDLLSRESAHATFFVTGNNVVQHPDIVQRALNEGHAIGNHTFSHIDFNSTGRFTGEQEINQTERAIVASTGRAISLFRPPYGGSTDQSLRNSLNGILTAQRLGYSVVTYDFDSDDWKFTGNKEPTYPNLEGKSQVLLLHDGGGDRSKTIEYTEELIKRAKSKGYEFASIDTLFPQNTSNPLVTPSTADTISFAISNAIIVWPRRLVYWLFLLSIGSLFAISLLNIFLALFYRIRTKKVLTSNTYMPHVTIILPAFNEEAVLEKSVLSLLQTKYKKYKIVIVDDGSSDSSWTIAQTLEKRYKRVKAIHQENGGKSSALNNAIKRSRSEIVICVDADSLFSIHTIPNFVRHFEDPSVAAVAGVVKVGNPNSMLTRWQALEYASGISIERNAQALMNAIMIVPGACGAWRRSVIREVGGFSSSTLAEDCDLALKIQKTGKYKIKQDNEAISYTEAPQSITALTKQRFRWTFGTIQSLWKHRSIVFNEHYGWLGMYVMPSALISIIVPILFWPLLISLTVLNVLAGDYEMILLFFVFTLLIQIIIALIGIALAKEKITYIFSVPFGRLSYGPIRIYILYKTLFTIIKGVDVGWNKLTRTGAAQDLLGTNAVLLEPAKKRGLHILRPKH